MEPTGRPSWKAFGGGTILDNCVRLVQNAMIGQPYTASYQAAAEPCKVLHWPVGRLRVVVSEADQNC